MISISRRARRSLVATATAGIAALAVVGAGATGADAAPKATPGSPAFGITLARQWYDITDQTVSASGIKEPVTQSDIWATAWLAAARTAVATANPVAQDAGFAQALHDALVAYVPAQQPQLDAALASTLGSLPSGKARQDGTAAGAKQAAAALAQRAGDGLDVASVNVAFATPPAAPGVWQPTTQTPGAATTATAIRAGQGSGKSFLLDGNNQFDPGPPPALDSPTYLADLAEVHAVGAANSTVRTQAQTETALFWEPATNAAYVQVLRGILANTHNPLAWDARLVASFHIVTTDAQIAIYNAKYKYLNWRPENAIRTGAVDQDPNWVSLFAAPLHPEYPSGHSGYSGAATAVLTAFLGPRVPGTISVTSSVANTTAHSWSTFQSITDEIINARVWEGVHFRFSDNTGAAVGAKVGAWDVQHLHDLGI